MTAHRWDDIERAAAALKSGGVCIVPTDTRYALVADAFSAGAVQRLRELSGKSPIDPLGVFVASAAMAMGVCESRSGAMRELMDQVWPGPVTLLVSTFPSVEWHIGETRGTVGIRVPQDDAALALCRRIGPLVATTAQNSGIGSMVQSGADAERVFAGSVDVVVDRGFRSAFAHSVVIDCTGETPRELRAMSVGAGRGVRGSGPAGRPTRPGRTIRPSDASRLGRTSRRQR